MSKHRNLPLVFGFLVMAASAGLGQVNTLKPGGSQRIEQEPPPDRLEPQPDN